MHRRSFIKGLGQAGAVLATGSLPGLALPRAAQADQPNAGNAPTRRAKAFKIRIDAAKAQASVPLPAHLVNSDDIAYVSKFASYTKGLPHSNGLGEVDPAAYQALLTALRTGSPADFAAIPRGGVARLVNPQAALAYQLEGADSHHLAIAAAPSFSSEAQAGEMIEVYWAAMARDVLFSQYGLEPITSAAIADLSRFSNFRGTNAGNLFRGRTPGDHVGPYVSQFLLKDIPYGMTTITQAYRTGFVGNDHMTNYGEWLNIQNGLAASAPSFDTPRHVVDGRGLGEYVHADFTYQAYLNAALILLDFGGPAMDDNNPYPGTWINQQGFATLGGPDVLDMVAKAANYALKAAWYQKWSLHRKLRPEVMAGRVHNHVTGAASYPIHAKLLDSPVLSRVFSRHGGYLLPMAYPEGSPLHPSYPAGHGAISGACATILKAFFKESFVIPGPVVASDDGRSLLPYAGSLTVGAELNKLASNITRARDLAGVHYLSDGYQGMLLGEKVALAMLKDLERTYNEGFGGFKLTKFDGTTITT